MERLRLLEIQQDKRTKEKKKQDEERKKEEELRKTAEDEKQRANEAKKINQQKTTMAVVSPTEGQNEQAGDKAKIHRLLQLGGLENEKEDESIAEIASLEDEDGNEGELRSPVKKKGQKKATFADVIMLGENTKTSKGKATPKPEEAATNKPRTVQRLKPAIRKSPPHFHVHQCTIIESCIQISGDNPEGKFVHVIQELLRNGQIVDKHFAYVPIRVNGATTISDPSKIPINMTQITNARW